MILEAVTVCVGYADFLGVAAPYNRPVLDRWLIVTRADDLETRQVCHRYNLECLLTEDGPRDGAFSKGRLIERGLQHLRAEGWRLHLDADIVLPAHTRHALEAAHLDPSCIYGADRVLVGSWADWGRLRDSGYLQTQHDYHTRVRIPAGFGLGSRWASPAAGYVPIGFFQLWHSSQDEWRGTRIRPYPVQHGNACRTDVQHGLRWDRRRRVLLPELFVIHLESEPAPLGANWKGRRTRRFGPDQEAQAAGGSYYL